MFHRHQHNYAKDIQAAMSAAGKSVSDFYDEEGKLKEGITQEDIIEQIFKDEDITKLKEEASNRKEICYHVVIVQPGMSKSNCTHEMKILLGNTVQVLHEMANIDCRVICSE